VNTSPVPSVRIDSWLNAARIYKSRSVAQEACTGGHVRVNGQAVRASHAVRVGDEVSASAPRGEVVLEIKALGEKRLAADKARELYLDHSPPPPPREPRFAPRERGAGRPTKADRRATDKLRYR
jgi:ribosome-associated heat shock protein Hsp15